MRRQRPGKQPEVCQASVCGPSGAGVAYRVHAGAYAERLKQCSCLFLMANEAAKRSNLCLVLDSSAEFHRAA